MAGSKYKLTYFNTKGLGEGIRYLFAYAGVDFEDNRIEKEDWPAIKEKQPYGAVPVLEVDGQILNQSAAILRFLGKRFGFVANDPFTEALLEALVDNIKDTQIKLKAVTANRTPETEKVAKESITFLLSKIDKLAADGFFYGSKATWVDFYFAGLFEAISDHHYSNILDPYPNLVKLTNNIKSNDGVQKYIKQRTVSNVVFHK